MKIGVDCDGVLYHWERTARYMLRRKLRREGRPSNEALNVPSVRWNYIKDIVEAEDWKWLWNEGVRDGLFRYGHVIGGSLEGMQALEELGEIVIVTSRPAHAVKDTIAWLGLMCDKVDLRGVHILSSGEPKSSLINAEGLDVLIDDGPHNVEDTAQNTSAVAIVYDQPWNRGLYQSVEHRDTLPLEDIYHNVDRAFDWTDVVRIVEDLA